MKQRVYTAVLRDSKVLMVRHVHDGRDYWTTPGGGVEQGESPIEAARREVLEETGIDVRGLAPLFVDDRGMCFLGTCDESACAMVGRDPELTDDAQWIADVHWFDLEDKADDWQVAEVLRRLGTGV